ncbi:MAG: hypothetical protein JXA36_04130 [Coriobacteriia bacterium]|nr:hypothetical protein [Coriobacteriia bacterium]
MCGYPLADSGLARRIERAGVGDMIAWVHEAREGRIYPEAASLKVGGGVAVWFEPDNIVNGSLGLGMDRRVEREEIAAMVAFFAERGASASTNVCPHADSSLMRWLAEYGFLAADFEMVLYQPLPAASAACVADGVEVRIAVTPEERGIWADLEARGFTDDKASEGHHTLSRSISLRADGVHFIGYLEGEPVGTGMLNIVDGVAMFNGDSTLPCARGRGVQTSILAERLRYAADAGCDIGVIEATPGGVSQRNQERAGFRHAYTRVGLELPHRS